MGTTYKFAGGRSEKARFPGTNYDGCFGSTHSEILPRQYSHSLVTSSTLPSKKLLITRSEDGTRIEHHSTLQQDEDLRAVINDLEQWLVDWEMLKLTDMKYVIHHLTVYFVSQIVSRRRFG
ncbi:hypothetical protein AB6A40_007702 [Gnathostoma spinigerum]|uniref:Uncharacterized protein n=1 Tax=Gnathostoma spinigerum TaxID=75299 RepID=A0ABD6ELZ8_9BILA